MPTSLALIALAAACSSGGEGLTLKQCTDGKDNDGNGLVDCDDPGCEAYDTCGGDTGGDAGPKPEVTVNEFQASNATTVTDEAGAYPDWIELYNYGDADVSMAGWTITDDLDEPDKFTLPDLTIKAGDFVVLWADGDTDEGALHLSFALAKEGEAIGLYDEQGRALTELVYEEQGTDWSAARIPDASSNWETTNQPTPGAPNKPSE